MLYGTKRNIREFTQVLSRLLKDRRQRVVLNVQVLNVQVSTWTNVTAGVPKASILGPLLFLLYINNLSEGLSTNNKLFADDTLVFSVIMAANKPKNSTLAVKQKNYLILP